jgi:dephospho-CoA kinase
LHERLRKAGGRGARGAHLVLAYAPEIAAAMLRRQQAAAIIAARQKIVEGAVSMVEMALKALEERGVARFDATQKQAIVGNIARRPVQRSRRRATGSFFFFRWDRTECRGLRSSAIVGGIGSGKTAVANTAARAGCVVSDSDALAHAALRDPKVRERDRVVWGAGVVDGEGNVDRSVVGKNRVCRPEGTVAARGAVHSLDRSERERAFAAAPRGTKALVDRCAALARGRLGASCTWCSSSTRRWRRALARVRAARGWDEAELARREAAQWPIDRKRAASHHVVTNDGDLDSLRAQVRSVLEDLLTKVQQPLLGETGQRYPEAKQRDPNAIGYGLNFEYFKPYLKPEDAVLDFGCGNAA